MNLFRKKFLGRTYIKYFLSYLVIFTVLILGFFFIVKNQIARQYFQEKSEQTLEQLGSIAGQLDDELVFLSQMHSSLASSEALRMTRYKTEVYYWNQAYQEMCKYDYTTQLIDSVVYKATNSREILSTKQPISYNDDVFYIHSFDVREGKLLAFDPADYYGASYGQLIFLTDMTDTEMEYLIYFPPTSATARSILFYILDITEIERDFESYISDEMPAIALIDESGQFVVDVNAGLLEPYMDSFALQNGIYKMDSSVSICVQTGIGNGYSMISMISNDSLNRQIDVAFANSYLTLMLLSFIGFFLIFWAMRLTYTPLHRLMEKIVPDSDSKEGYLDQLAWAFSEAEDQNQLLRDKLDKYRLMIQKSLLDSLVASQYAGEANALPNIEQFFDTEANKEIFAIQMTADGKQLPVADIRKYFQEMLPGNDPCIMLESKGDSAVFLINFIGTEPDKAEVLKGYLKELYEEEGYLSAISNGSDSPMDIPALYENVMRAGICWPQVPVVDCRKLPPVSATFDYPYDKLNQLSEALKGNNFPSAREVRDELFRIIDQAVRADDNIPDFFVHSILVDMLTVIIRCMDEFKIKFKTYSDLYFETLYFCQSFPYVEKAVVIKANTGRLIDYYEEEFSSKLIKATQIRAVMENAYAEPDFSITMLAEQFRISATYMSILFKKELNQNFADYLWMLRLKKAKELLSTSDMSIDEVSVAVGYINTSSFRRKFKQETGLTPSQYRAEGTENRKK